MLKVILNVNVGAKLLPRPFTKSLKRRSIQMVVITEKAPTRAFSWLKVATTTFTFQTQALTPGQLDVKLGHKRRNPKGRAGRLA